MPRSPLLAGYIPFDDTDFTSNTDGSGDVVVTLPAGLYFPAPYERVCILQPGTGATVSTFAGTIAVGEVVEIYDISADAVLYTGLTVTAVGSGTITLDQSVTVGGYDRLYPVGGLQGNIEARIAASDIPAGSDTTYLYTPSDGVLYFATDSGATIAWDDPYLARVLRFDEDTTLSFDDAPSTAPAERSVLGWFKPSRAIVEDLPRKRRNGQTYVSDAGTFRKLVLPRITRHALTVRYRGGPRATDWSEIHAWEDLCELLEAGYKFRWYVDVDTTLAPYARKTNPYGWEEWHVEDGAEFEPRNPVGGVYDNWTQELRLIAA